MNMNKWLAKLEDFLDLSKHEQEKKHKKLLKIIRKLEEKKHKLEDEVVNECKADDTSHRCHELTKELKVVSKLVKKAKKHDSRRQA
ncbi:MAG: hypothetical protein KJP11_09700 [Gammaproteobacteria bacterium]|nr:hypothetical protein [Gammaproteobacteria bacterium]